jgi:SAM-dependent methyltransferase
MKAAREGLAQLKETLRTTWMAGDFGQIAKYTARGAEEFVERLTILPGMRVLDLACGTGNLAIPAARKGAHVTGIDIATNLLAQARQRAGAETLAISFEEGDAEDLPYPDGHFDLVMSMFGAMFALRPEKVSTELARVTRQGGRIAMANWTPDGLPGETFRLTSRYLPPPEGIAPPVLWGDEKVVRSRLAGHCSKIQTNRRNIDMKYLFSPRRVVQFFRENFGPTQLAFSRLDPAGQEAYARDLEELWRKYSQSGGDKEVKVRAEYLEVIATRA